MALDPPEPASPSAQPRVASAFHAAREGGEATRPKALEGEDAAAVAAVAAVAPVPPAVATQTLHPLRTSSIMRMVWMDSDS